MLDFGSSGEHGDRVTRSDLAGYVAAGGGVAYSAHAFRRRNRHDSSVRSRFHDRSLHGPTRPESLGLIHCGRLAGVDRPHLHPSPREVPVVTGSTLSVQLPHGASGGLSLTYEVHDASGNQSRGEIVVPFAKAAGGR